MKFYLLNDNQKPKVVAEKLEPGASPSALHEEISLPNTFFMQLPKGLMQRRLDNAYNANLEKQLQTNHGRGIINYAKTRYGNTVLTNQVVYETHLDVIPNLSKVSLLHTEECKIENPEKYADQLRRDPQTARRGTEIVHVKRYLPKGASFATLQKSYRDSDLGKVILVGFATFLRQPDMMFISDDLADIQHMLASCLASDSLPIRRYTQWTWYYINDLACLLNYTIELLASQSLNDSLQFLSSYGELLNNSTAYYGLPIRQEVEEFFAAQQLEMGGDTKVKLLDTIMGYMDDHQVSVCDVIQSLQPPELSKLQHLGLATDKAYVRTGQCGILGVNTSPLGKTLQAMSRNVASRYGNFASG